VQTNVTIITKNAFLPLNLNLEKAYVANKESIITIRAEVDETIAHFSKYEQRVYRHN